MDYKVLYRKYRPKTFDEVVGQTNTINILKDSIINNKISHAYIFSGPRGTGKTSCAKIFAKAINCLSCEEGNPCNSCDNCNTINNSDIFEIDAASNNGVDQIRELINNIKLAPINSKYKVYIIDEVHMLSNSAFNALLLTLEEPPSHVVFILATTNIEEVPITVLSRCQRMDFHKIAKKDIESNLITISKKEKIDIEDDAIEEIADYSEGGMRDALSILDQLSKQNTKITDDMVLKTVGLISTSELQKVVSYLEEGNIEEIINTINKMRELSADFKTIVKRLIEIIKTKAINIKSGKEESTLTYNNYKDLCFELAACIYKCNINIDSYDLLELILIDYVNKNISREIFLEKSKDVKITTKQDTIVKNNKINELTENDKNISDDKIIINEIIDIRLNNCFAKAEKKYKNENTKLWNEFINKHQKDKFIIKYIDSEVALASNDIIILMSNLPGNIEYLVDNINKLGQAFNKYSKTNYKFGIITKDKWNNEVEKYKDNIKNKIKYEILEEPIIKNHQEELVDIFDNNKIEVI